MITVTINGTTIGNLTIATRTFDQSEVVFDSPVIGASGLLYDNALLVIPVGNDAADTRLFDDYAQQLGPQEVTLTFADPPELPEYVPQPDGPTARLLNNISGFVRVAWSAITGATGYQLYATTSADPPTDATAPTHTAGSTTFNLWIPGLTSRTTYRIYVRATLADGVTKWSDPVVVTTM